MKAEVGVYPKERQILHEIVPLDTPLCIDLHISNYCNFKCNYCIRSTNTEQVQKSVHKCSFMSWEVFSLAVEQLKSFQRKLKMVTLCGIGEPLLHPRLTDMVELLNDSMVTDKIQTITNASRLNPSLSDSLIAAGLGELRISLQGLDSEKYLQIADVKIDWNELYDNICYFSSIRSNCKLKVKIADTALEDGDEKKFYALFGDICDAVDIEHICNPWAQLALDIDIKTTGSKKTRFGREFVDLKVCRRIFTSFDVMPDGLTTQGCHATFGFEKNIKEVALKEQWLSADFNRIRIDMLRGKRNQWSHCEKCEYINDNWHPEDVLDGHEDEILARLSAQNQHGM